MKRILLFAVAALVFAGCVKQFTVGGQWPEGIGQTVSVHSDGDDDAVLAESIVNEDGTFTIKGKFEYETKMIFYAGDKKCIDIFVDTNPVELDVETIDGRFGPVPKATVVNPSIDQRILNDALMTGMSYSLIHLAVPSAINKALETATSQDQIDSLLMGYDKAMQQAEDLVNEHLDTISNSIASVYTFKSILLKYRPIDEVKERYENLSDKVKKSYLGKKLAEDIEVAATTAVGGIPADFTLQTPSGEDFSLYSLRGHHVILDFWASWCGPCRAEMPNVKEIYAKHHGDGLEILGVSLDDDADKWQKCIEDMDLPWYHVSALKGWDCPVAAYFKVTGVPAMFILDPDGVIIAQNLRGQELADFIDNLYK